MNRPTRTKKPRSWKATNETTYPLGGRRHGLIPGHLPLHGDGVWRKLSGLDKAEQLLTRHVGSRPVRHGSGGVSGDLVAQAVAALQMRKSEGSKVQRQRKTMTE
jgi:hypothetical protein